MAGLISKSDTVLQAVSPGCVLGLSKDPSGFPQLRAQPQERALLAVSDTVESWSHRRTFISVTFIHAPGEVLGAGCLVVKKTTSWAQLLFQQRKVSDHVPNCRSNLHHQAS